MKKLHRRTLFLALICLLVGLVGGGYIWMKRGIPFVSQREQWTIGIYRSNSPFHFNKLQGWINPLFRAEDVTDVRADFVADPFLVKEAETWNLFFEVYNNDTRQGDLAVATSKNTWIWHYEKVILDEPFHLSYPYVFKSEDEYYLIPESFEDNSIRLYKADQFPTHWSYVKTLVEVGIMWTIPLFIMATNGGYFHRSPVMTRCICIMPTSLPGHGGNILKVRLLLRCA